MKGLLYAAIGAFIIWMVLEWKAGSLVIPGLTAATPNNPNATQGMSTLSPPSISLNAGGATNTGSASLETTPAPVTAVSTPLASIVPCATCGRSPTLKPPLIVSGTYAVAPQSTVLGASGGGVGGIGTVLASSLSGLSAPSAGIKNFKSNNPTLQATGAAAVLGQ